MQTDVPTPRVDRDLLDRKTEELTKLYGAKYGRYGINPYYIYFTGITEAATETGDFRAEFDTLEELHHYLNNKIRLFGGSIPKARKIKLPKAPKVQQMYSSNGNAVPNQFIIWTEQGRYFQSYQSVIAFKPLNNKYTILDINKWDYSVTTGRYRNQFLDLNKKETQERIDSGEYILANLN